MACLIPQRIVNPHYRKITASLSELYEYENEDDFYIDVPCGRCINCQRSRSTMWRVRLINEYEGLTPAQRINSYVVTLTLSDKYLKMDVAVMIRRFLERVRRRYRRSVKHWIITEYGDTTQRLHFHGILFDIPFHIYELSKLWSYGFVDYDVLSMRSIPYITKYITKGNTSYIVPPERVQRVFVSPALGKHYVEHPKSRHRIAGSLSPFMYSGSRTVAMPRYYRGKIFTEDELRDLRDRYYAQCSDDVIPDPPYRIGNREFDDYTLYMAECRKILGLYRKHYKKKSYGKLDKQTFGCGLPAAQKK